MNHSRVPACWTPQAGWPTPPGIGHWWAQVVTKLFHITEPDAAFFGKKDYQQWRVIQVGPRHTSSPHCLPRILWSLCAAANAVNPVGSFSC